MKINGEHKNLSSVFAAVAGLSYFVFVISDFFITFELKSKLIDVNAYVRFFDMLTDISYLCFNL